ncbi:MULTISPECIES: IclR family transcriptional regulator [unclassified Salinibacterium]|uniref:IclR family transcriptional regulator n=1 Tax=unclassified Salinibacterium TaxID=2632331 RepID=UPI00143CF845|nr:MULTISPECIES: IclR family transcriptional regulator [unclassified Salinibacterium]
MKKNAIQARPTYVIESVDNVLRLLQLLRDSGSLRVTDAAAELDIALSTAHRLFSMLVYRGFATQDEQRRYVPGPAMDARAIRAPWTRELRDLAAPEMEALSGELGETINIMIRVGTDIRFLHTVEGGAVLRVGDRTGSVVPALHTSGGKIMLAHEPAEKVRALYRSRSAVASGRTLDETSLDRLLGQLMSARSVGFAVNREESEDGVGAVGVAILTPGGAPFAAISVACPVGRLDRLLAPETVTRVQRCAIDVAELAASYSAFPQEGGEPSR